MDRTQNFRNGTLAGVLEHRVRVGAVESAQSMGNLHRSALLALASLHLLACVGWGPATPQPCWPAFPYADGWLGGDGAYSVPLSSSETVWLFGDTFVGPIGLEDRVGSTFVHNTVAVSRCHRDGRWEIDYAWGAGPAGEPRSFLARDGQDAWWWLFDGFVHENRLYLGLLEVEKTEPRGPLSMPFGFTGMDLGRVHNPRDPPVEWQVDVIELSSNPRALPASAMALHEGHAYLFVFLDEGDGRYPRGLSRLPLGVLDGKTRDVSSSLEYLATDGTWKPGLDAGDLRILMEDAATEMSVRFHPTIGRWLALYNYPDVGPGFPDERPSDAVWIRTADRLEGPWSERRLVFRIPELSARFAAGYDPNTGCYAAKEHPQLSSEARLTFTYVCNLFTGRGQDPIEIGVRLLENMSLYRPVPVSVELPQLPVEVRSDPGP